MYLIILYLNKTIVHDHLNINGIFKKKNLK